MTSQEVCILFTYYHLVNGKHWLNLQCFQKQLKTKNFYSAEISKYLKKYFNLDKFTKSDHEKGVIPMHYISCASREMYNIGTRGGAVRPSSGYAFYFLFKNRH